MLSGEQRRRICGLARQIATVPSDWMIEHLARQIAAVVSEPRPMPRGMRALAPDVSCEIFSSNAEERGRIGNTGRLQRRLNRAFRTDVVL